MKLIYLLSSIAFLIIIGASATIPAHQNLPPRKISIGYDFDKVGNDSVLVIQGKFVRENGGRVYVKVN